MNRYKKYRNNEIWVKIHKLKYQKIDRYENRTIKVISIMGDPKRWLLLLWIVPNLWVPWLLKYNYFWRCVISTIELTTHLGIWSWPYLWQTETIYLGEYINIRSTTKIFFNDPVTNEKLLVHFSHSFQRIIIVYWHYIIGTKKYRDKVQIYGKYPYNSGIRICKYFLWYIWFLFLWTNVCNIEKQYEFKPYSGQSECNHKYPIFDHV